MTATEETSPLLNGDNPRSYDGTNANGQNEEEVTKPQNYLSLIIPLALGVFLAAMDGTIVVSSFASIGSELNSLQNTSWIATAYMLTMTSFQPLYGKLSDIFGRKNCLLFAYTIFALGCLCCGLATDMNQLVLSRALSGIGGGGMTTIVSIILSDVIPLRSRGTWQGILNIIWSVGSATGAPLGGFLVDSIGWRWAFLIQAPIAALAIISVSLALHLPKPDSSHFRDKLARIDFSGALALVITVFSLLFGLDRGGNVSWSDPYTIASLFIFIFAFALFIAIETQWAAEPFAPSRIILNRSLIFAYLVNFFGVAAAMTTIFHTSLYLQAVLGKTASQAGAWLVLSVIGGLTGSLGGGLIIQATGKFYAVTVVAYGLFLVGTIGILLNMGVIVKSTIGVAAGLMISSVGNGGGITTTLIALIANAGQEDQAIATAVSYLFRSLGSVVGISVGSTIVQETLRTYLWRHLSGENVSEIILRVRESLDYIDTLDPETRAIVRAAYTFAVQAAIGFSVIVASFAFVSSIFVKEKALTR